MSTAAATSRALAVCWLLLLLGGSPAAAAGPAPASTAAPAPSTHVTSLPALPKLAFGPPSARTSNTSRASVHSTPIPNANSVTIKVAKECDEVLGQRCERTEDCRYQVSKNETLQVNYTVCAAGRCRCTDSRQFSREACACLRAVTRLGQPCTSEDVCFLEANGNWSQQVVECRDGNCTCRTEYTPFNATYCGKREGNICKDHSECTKDTLFSRCSDGSCRCEQERTFNGTHCLPSVTNLGGSCDNQTQICSLGGVVNWHLNNRSVECWNGVCQCRDGYSQYNNNCSKLPGDPCTEHARCSEAGWVCADSVCRCEGNKQFNGTHCLHQVDKLGEKCYPNEDICFLHEDLDWRHQRAECRGNICQCKPGYKTINETSCVAGGAALLSAGLLSTLLALLAAGTGLRL